MKPTILNPELTIPVIANIPHASAFVPEHVRNQFVITDEELAEENRKLVDWFTDELYSPIVAKGGSALKHNVSRFVVDPERFEDDAQECMAARGMGVMYTHGCSRQRVRRDITSGERESLLNEFYRPYHSTMFDMVDGCIKKFGRCVFIDCHSYPEKMLPYEIHAPGLRADIVLGTDSHHTPGWLIEKIEALVKEAGYSFGLNDPFAGTVVPLALYKDSRVTAFMLEINRATYMNEVTTTRTDGFPNIQALVAKVVEASLEIAPVQGA
jgi:N-formylglutamate amidohydrolase